MAADGRRIRKGALRRNESALHQNMRSNGARRRVPIVGIELSAARWGTAAGGLPAWGLMAIAVREARRYVAVTVGTVREQSKHERRDVDGIVRRAPSLL